MLLLNVMQIEKGQHVFVAGQTGTGKSVLAEVYVSGGDNAICLDTKGETNWTMIRDVTVFDRLENLVNFKEGKAIYRPRFEELSIEYYDKFFEWIYRRKNTDVWIDELMSIYENANSILPYHKAILTRGRTKKISCWNVTQRPKTIPLGCISESKHFFIFDLNLDADRKRIMEVVAHNEINTIASKAGGEYAFWYYNFKMQKPVLGKFKFQ
jgi:ABC-type dipeptide/oligopeptide/nickel transport system ATPase component